MEVDARDSEIGLSRGPSSKASDPARSKSCLTLILLSLTQFSKSSLRTKVS